MIQAGFLVDLRGVQFDDAATSTWIQALPLGEYDHPLHGKISITPERVQRFAANVNGRVRETDLDIDYDHKATGGEAAGWVRQAESRPDGLWIFVEWTKRAYALIKEKAYRYFSPEFVDEWTHPKNKQTFKDVLFGGGITNRPFLKDILPINMTEFVNASGGTSMDPAEVLKQLAKLFGLPEDTDPGVTLGYVQAKIGEKPADDKEETPEQKAAKEKATADAATGAQTPEQIAASEKAAADAKALAEKNGLNEDAIRNLPFVKNLMETVVNQGKKLDEDAVNKAVVQLSEKAAEKHVAIPPVIKTDLAKQLSDLPPAARPGLIKLMETMIENGQLGVKLGEDGHAGGQQSKTATDALNAAVTKKMSEGDGKLGYADAVELVTRENPQLYADYQRELVNS